MAQRTTLTEQQVQLLRWIADGCPDGVMDNDWHRISAAALRRRGLVNVSGRGGTWKATLTAAGHEYLASVDSSEPPVARQANVSVTQQLMDEVMAAGGVLRVQRKSYYDPDRVDHAYRARLAERYGKVPDGKRLIVTQQRDETEIRLEDAPHRTGPRPELVPVNVPERVGRYHPAARNFRDLAARHAVSRQLIGRATRILHGIAKEVERRGWQAASTDGGGVHLTAEDYSLWVHIDEEGVHERGRWDADVERYRSVSRWSILDGRERHYPTGPYDADASGRLRVTLDAQRSHIFDGRQSRWADRQSWTLDERLPHLFREIEERIRLARHHEIERRIAAEQTAKRARREAEEREHTWHRLIARAKERLIETHRAARLRAEADAWHDAERLRRYCDAMATRYGDHAVTTDWLAWARAYADGLDPLMQPPSMPAPPDVTPEALQDHLPQGWSAHGPDHDGPRWR